MTTMAHEPQELPPSAAMIQMLAGLFVSRMIHAAATLGVADHLADGAKTSAQLAEATQTHAPSLYRVLRALAAVGVVHECEPDCFVLTPVGETLRTDVPGSLRHFAMAVFGQEHYTAHEALLHSIRTGETAFDHVFGMDVWSYYAQHPENAGTFNRAMADLTEVFAAPALAQYDFDGLGTIVDVGGGQGALLAAVLKANPAAQGVLYDQPEVVRGARTYLEAQGVADRCRRVGGSFFEAVPEGGDAYLLKAILHDWDDPRALTILRNCRRAMAPQSRLLIFETVLPPGNEPSLGKIGDVVMMVMTGGRERTEGEFRRLLEEAGLEMTRVVPTTTLTSIIEARPA